MLVDSGVACHVCPPSWAQRRSPENKQFQSLVKMTESGVLAPIAEDVRGLGPQPVRPLVRAVRQPNCPTPEDIARHALTHLPAAAWCEACVNGRGKEASPRDRQGTVLDGVLPVISDYGYLRSFCDMPILDKHLGDFVNDEGAEWRVRCRCVRLVDLGAGSRSCDHPERRTTRYSRSCGSRQRQGHC